MKKDKLIVEGLAGKKTLNGEVRINGAKNAALKVMASAILFDGPIFLKNAPRTEDTNRMSELLTIGGATVAIGDNTVSVDATTFNAKEIDADIAQSMRSSVLMTGPMLGRFGSVTFPVPGGCVIGARPIDLFIDAYQKMGATVSVKTKGNIDEYFIQTKKLTGAEIFFNLQTVTGTETIMMAAVLAHGTTVLKNCAMEPEIVSLAEFLNSCGASITGAGTSTITIEGRGGKLLKGTGEANPYITIPDRIETGSFLLLGALCADNLKITHCNPQHVELLINLLRQSGVSIKTTATTIELIDNAKVSVAKLKPFNIRTHEYPGFATDLQSIVTVYLSQIHGESTVFETIYEGRLKFVENLKRLGANIIVMNPREVLINGGQGELRALPAGEELDAFDLRAGFATIMAALLASGTSVISNAYFIDRGYENIEERLSALGANVRRVHGDSGIEE